MWRTGAEGDRLREGGSINKSLSTLGLVISHLADIAMGKKIAIVDLTIGEMGTYGTPEDRKKEAEDAAAKIVGQSFVIIRQASDSGSLYGSVSTRDAAEVAVKSGFVVDKNQISLRRPIKELGIHEVSIVLHPEVETAFTLNIARSEEEATLQAKGKSIQQLAAEAEAEAEFEIAELFDDIGAAASMDDDLVEPSQEDGKPTTDELIEK